MELANYRRAISFVKRKEKEVGEWNPIRGDATFPHSATKAKRGSGPQRTFGSQQDFNLNEPSIPYAMNRI